LSTYSEVFLCYIDIWFLTNNIESSEYNIQPRRKGILDFPGNVVGGLELLDGKKLEANPKKDKFLYVHGTKTSIIRG
jgi:hypothetical protein